MIFTIGETEIYDRNLRNGIWKEGKQEPDYPGGSVFETIEDAEGYLTPDFSIYVLDGDWKNDVYEKDGMYHLLYNRQVIGKI